MDVTELRVYRQSLENLKELYELVYKISLQHLKLRTQMINSGEAVPALISEAFSKRGSVREARRFFLLAMTESDEVITHLRKLAILSIQLRNISVETCRNLAFKYKSLSKQLNTLSRTWRSADSFRSPTSEL